MSFKYEHELLESALSEFSSKSYDESSLNTIIKKSGMSKGAFYHHFKNKYDIYIYLLKDSFDKKWQFINSEQSLKSDNLDIFETLSYQMKLGLSFGNKYPKYEALSQKLIKEKDKPIYKQVLVDLGGDSTKTLENMIFRAIKNQEFSKEYTDDFILKLISSLFNLYHDIFTDFNDIDQFLHFLKKGLGK
ncbi:MAG: TetR/AcrR family transcriptional regulator [Spirochaetaceae bacterium]